TATPGGFASKAGRTVHFSSVDQPGGHAVDGDAPEDEREGDKAEEADDVDSLEAEGGAADELDELVQRVELGDDLQPLRKSLDREEGPGHEEQRRHEERRDVV